jgi:hypothetical protein
MIPRPIIRMNTYSNQGSVLARMKSHKVYSVLTDRLHGVTSC